MLTQGDRGAHACVHSTDPAGTWLQVGGGDKDFDPSVYSQQILINRQNKKDSSRRAYTGAGHILAHDSLGGPPPGTPALCTKSVRSCPYDTDLTRPDEAV